MDNLIKNQKYTVRIDGYSSDASGVCHINGCAVFVPRAIPGELWEVKLLKVGKNFAYAKGETLLEPSPARVEPACPHYGKCGGCDTMHMSYDEELRFKLGRVNEAFSRIGKQAFTASKILGSDTINEYRNKGIFVIGECDGKAVPGFYRERSHSIVPVSTCLIQDSLAFRAAQAVTDFMNLNGFKAYNEEAGSGTVRHVFCRKAVNTGDRLLCIVSRKGFGAKTDAFVSFLRKQCPELTGIVLNINRSIGNTVLTGDFYTLWGKGSITDILCGFSFDIAPQAFFQINPPQAEKLYSLAVEYAEPSPDKLIFDLYCGAGTISLALSKNAGQVIGAEIVPEAIENAKKNAAANGVKNAEFICADAAEAAKELAARGLHPDVVSVDPPRKGMSEEAVRAVAQMHPERIVYVSCDSATLARDILRFNTYGYELTKATAVDMFPRTRHVETVVLLSDKKVDGHMEDNSLFMGKTF